MSILVIGGTGFIGRRLVPLLAQRGEEIVCMDINPATANYGVSANKCGWCAAMSASSTTSWRQWSQPSPSGWSTLPISSAANIRRGSRSSSISSAWTIALKRHGRASVRRVAYASSLAVSGEQHFYGDRTVNEDDFRHGHVQYAMHKIFNEWQAQDYREKHGLDITAIRPANVTGNDKIVGSVDHVKVITFPARGEPISFPFKDAMRCPIHVDEVAEIFARVIMSDRPKQWIYNTGGVAISLGEIADIVREYLPDAKISFDKDTAAKRSRAIT